MKANKRVRDLKRRSARRLWAICDGVPIGVTTYPLSRKDEHGKQNRNGVQMIAHRRMG